MKKKGFTRSIALMMAAAMMSGAVLSGCGTADPGSRAEGSNSQAEESNPRAEESNSQSEESNSQAEDSDSQAEESGSRAGEEDSFLTGEKPELSILYVAQPNDMNQDPGKDVMEEVSGYQVTYHNLPAENGEEKLMLEVASGADYDMIYNMSYSVFTQLVDKNALMDLRPLLEKYGSNILENVDDLTWSAVSDEEGHIWGIPKDAADPTTNTYPESITSGIAFRSDVLKELGYDIPATLDEFYNVCKAYTEKTGNPALTMSRYGWVVPIMSAFGLGGSNWYDVNGVQTPRIRMEGFKDYMAFMQKLYSEGILDNDMPINAAENAKEKFTSNTALCTPLAFWDIPGIKEALAISNPDAKAVFASLLARDADTPAFLSSNQGVSQVSMVIKNAKNPEHAVIWYNSISDTENFRKIYIGEENVSYEVREGNYYPIFPAFDAYQNSDRYTGTVTYEEQKSEWAARARKTPEMEEAFDQMNEKLSEYEFYLSCEGFVTDPALNEYQPALNTAIDDLLVKAIAEGTDPQAVLDEMLATWEREGGLECEQAMQKWYDSHQDLLTK